MPGRKLTSKPLPSSDYLHECFDYDPLTGVLRWKTRPRSHFMTARGWKITNRRFAGTPVTSSPDKHYDHIRLNYEGYLRHRVIWKLVTGDDPLDTIDHINKNPKDHRWDNLREATHSEQRLDAHTRGSISGTRGVYPNGKGWQARICLHRKIHYLGTYPTIEEAGEVYRNAARELHKQFSVSP